jgi:uncharacterized membrane protein YjjP (DUF1212 family)
MPDMQALQAPGRLGAAETLGPVLEFGAAMLAAGATAERSHQAMSRIARRCGPHRLSASISVGAITATLAGGASCATMVAEVPSGGVNAARISALDRFARSSDSLDGAGVVTFLASISAVGRLHPPVFVAFAVASACGCFAYLNKGDAADVVAAAIGGGLGQGARAALGRFRLNAYASTAVTALVSAAVSAAASAAFVRLGLGDSESAVALISSVLFLIPGYPLVAALLDLMRGQTLAASTRLLHALGLLAVTAFCLAVVTHTARLDLAATGSSDGHGLLASGAVTLVAAGSLAILFNSPRRTVLLVGALASVGNMLRLALLDAGLSASPSAFVGAFTIGAVASALDRFLEEPRITLTVPAIVVMVPGLYAFRMLVLFNAGRVSEALQDAAAGSLVIGAMAMGLAVTRVFASRD